MASPGALLDARGHAVTPFMINSLDGRTVTFHCEYRVRPTDVPLALWFAMQQRPWEILGRPTELLITVEGITDGGSTP